MQRFENFVCPLLALGMMLIGGLQIFADEDRTRPTVTLKYLERRKQEQEIATKDRQAFFGFQFANRVAESRIQFEHHIVDDAAKTYKAAHYDHGNGLAVAEVTTSRGRTPSSATCIRNERSSASSIRTWEAAGSRTFPKK